MDDNDVEEDSQFSCVPQPRPVDDAPCQHCHAHEEGDNLDLENGLRTGHVFEHPRDVEVLHCGRQGQTEDEDTVHYQSGVNFSKKECNTNGADNPDVDKQDQCKSHADIALRAVVHLIRQSKDVVLSCDNACHDNVDLDSHRSDGCGTSRAIQQGRRLIAPNRVHHLQEGQDSGVDLE